MKKSKKKKQKTIKQAGQSYPLKIKNSKFIASIYPVKTEKEAKDFLKRIKDKFNDATHNVYAYRIMTEEGIFQRANDDGEPHGTAGGSILYVLEMQKLINLIVVVTRYYGGKKLGKGGLMRAYTKSTSDLIKL